MMGGHKVDELWWWSGKAFVSYAGRAEPAMVAKMNASTRRVSPRRRSRSTFRPFCQARSRAISDRRDGKIVGDGRFARPAGDTPLFRASPEFDEAMLALGRRSRHRHEAGPVGRIPTC